MGLSSSQARLLNLTSRMHQIEYKAAKLEAMKLQMANESTRVYEDYLNALEKTKVQVKTLTTDGAVTYVDITSYGQFVSAGFALVYNNEIYSDENGLANIVKSIAINEKTGLNPDMCQFDGSEMQGWGGRRNSSNNFRYDSWRVPMNITLDYEWSCADREWQQQYGEKIQNFFYSQGVNDFVDQYRTDGTLPEENEILGAGGFRKLRHSIGLVATTAAASMMCSHDKSKEFVDALWNAKHEPFEDGYFDAYYDGLLRLFAFMHLSGNYQIIFPKK